MSSTATALALSCCCCGGLHSALCPRRQALCSHCLHCICTILHCVCTVSAPLLCALLQLSHFHFALRWLGCAGWAGLGWAGVSVLCHREGSFSPGATWRGQTRGHMPIHCTIHMPGSECHSGKKDGMSEQQMITSRVFTMCHAMRCPTVQWCCARCSVHKFILSTLLFSGYCFVVDAC